MTGLRKDGRLHVHASRRGMDMGLKEGGEGNGRTRREGLFLNQTKPPFPGVLGSVKYTVDGYMFSGELVEDGIGEAPYQSPAIIFMDFGI